MTTNLPECPPSLKAIQHYIKTAAEHDGRDPVIAYWCRLHALQTGLKLKKTPEDTKFLVAIMEWLENMKKSNQDNDAYTNEVAAQAHLENYALKLFLYADKQDREMNYGKNVVKAFYTAGMVYDVLTTFGELTEEASQNRKYAKWKAAYIHNCLKNGETPVPGPMQSEGQDNDENTTTDNQPNYSGTQINTSTSPTSDPGALPTIPEAPTSFNSSLPDPNAVNQLPPVPYTPVPNPGGFVPYEPTGHTMPSVAQPSPLYGDTSNSLSVELNPEKIKKAQKYCKWAGSALNYDDIKTAIVNLKNALALLETGHDPA